MANFIHIAVHKGSRTVDLGTFKEEEHPRANNGEFSKIQGTGASNIVGEGTSGAGKNIQQRSQYIHSPWVDNGGKASQELLDVVHQYQEQESAHWVAKEHTTEINQIAAETLPGGDLDQYHPGKVKVYRFGPPEGNAWTKDKAWAEGMAKEADSHYPIYEMDLDQMVAALDLEKLTDPFYAPEKEVVVPEVPAERVRMIAPAKGQQLPSNPGSTNQGQFWHTDSPAYKEHKQRVSQLADSLCKEMNYPRERVQVLDEAPKFTLNGRNYYTAGDAAITGPDRGRVRLFPLSMHNSQESIEGVLAHEIGHQVYQNFSNQKDREMFAMATELQYEGGWSSAYEPGSKNTVLKKEFAEKYPTLAEWDRLIEGNKKKLEKDDGFTPYSKEYWQALKTGERDWHIAMHETFAEITRLQLKAKREGRKFGMGQNSKGEWSKQSALEQLGVSLTWQRVFLAIQRTHKGTQKPGAYNRQKHRGEPQVDPLPPAEEKEMVL